MYKNIYKDINFEYPKLDMLSISQNIDSDAYYHINNFRSKTSDNRPSNIAELVQSLLNYCAELIQCQHSSPSKHDRPTDLLANAMCLQFEARTEKEANTLKIYDSITSHDCYIYPSIEIEDYTFLRESFPEVKISSSYIEGDDGAFSIEAFPYFFGIDMVADSIFSLLYEQSNPVTISWFDEEGSNAERKEKKFINNNKAFATHLGNKNYHGKLVQNILENQSNILPLKAICTLLPAKLGTNKYIWPPLFTDEKEKYTTIPVITTNNCYVSLLDSLCKCFPNTPWNTSIVSCKSHFSTTKREYFSRYTQNHLKEYIDAADASEHCLGNWDKSEGKFLNRYLFEKLSGLHSTVSVYNSLIKIPDNKARAYFAYTATDFLSKMPFSYGRSHIIRYLSELAAYGNESNMVISPERVNSLVAVLSSYQSFDYHQYRKIFFDMLTMICSSSGIDKPTLAKYLICFLRKWSEYLKLIPSDYCNNLYKNDLRYQRLNGDNPYRKTFCNISKLMIDAIGRNVVESVPKSLDIE